MAQQTIIQEGAFDSTVRRQINSNFDELFQKKNLPTVEWVDDFLGDVIKDQWIGLVGSDAQCVTPTISVSTSAGINGVVQLTAGDDAAATMAVNGCQLSSYRQFRASEGALVFEGRINLAAITNQSVFFGFTDISTLEMPANSAGSGNNITTNATDAVGFMFDTAMTDDNWWLVGVANDVDATAVNTGYAPVASTYNVFRIEVASTGAASFYIDGVLVGTMTGAVTTSVALTPTVAVFSRTTSTRIVNVDYLRIAKNRT